MADPAKPEDLMGPADGAEPTAAPARVFISYSSHDAEVAKSVCSALETAGFTCWIAPRDVVPGKLYADGIIRAIKDSTILVVVLSEHAVTSAHVGKELERASSKRHPIIALRIDTAPLIPAFEYFLSESQWIEVGTAGVDEAIRKLAAAVRRHLTPESPMDTGRRATTPLPIAEHSGVPPPGAQPSQNTSKIKNLNRPLVVIGVLIALVVAVYLVAQKYWLSKVIPEHPVAAVTPDPSPAVAMVSDKSVAVLPFVDMSEKKDQEYFSDGLSEELIDQLAHSPDLKVIARTSSFQFKGKNEDMRTIGQKLGVANLLEGSVRTSGKSLRVTAQLIKVSDGSHLWSETYDRDMGDVFKVQDSIAAAVVGALKAAIAVPTRSAPYKPKSTDAYNAFMRGNYFRRKNTMQDAERALASYTEAIRLDPGYADAWVGISYVHNDRGFSGWISPKDAYVEARKAIDHALGIDPNSADAYISLANIDFNYKFDFERARAENQRGHELDPTVAAYDDTEAIDALMAGRFDDSIRLFRQLVQHDPLNAGRLWQLTIALWYANFWRLDEISLKFVMTLKIAPKVTILEDGQPTIIFPIAWGATQRRH